MKAMILAAGLGTRLRPLTDDRPKALVELAGRTLLEITLSRLRTFGVTDVIINVHHFADMVTAYLKSKDNFGLRIEISREDILLDTGGGLKKAAWFFLQDSKRNASANPDEPFLLHNVDVISTIDLHRMVQSHKESHALATLAVQSRDSSRLLLFNNQLQLRGRRINNQDQLVSNSSLDRTGVDLLGNQAKDCHSERSEESASSSDSQLATHHSPLSLAFSGIHVISPRLLPLITEEGVFSIIPAYLRLAAHGENILAFRADEFYWRDLGKPADLSQAALDLQQSK
jgi:mannose-1-phosphate guanylyltransferase